MALRNKIQSYAVVSSTGVTATGTSNAVTLPFTDFDAITFKLTTANVSGTSPTLDMYIQSTDDGGTTWYDMYHFPQLTASTTNPYWAVIKADDASRAVGTVGSKTVSANTLGVPILSPTMRAAYTIGGTTPSFDITLTAEVTTANRGV